MSLKSRMKLVLETSRLNNNEKLVCMSILLNDQITIVDLHNCLSISRSMLIKITDMLLEYGYIKKESVACRSKCKDVWVINDNLFQSSDTTEKTYYREIND